MRTTLFVLNTVIAAPLTFFSLYLALLSLLAMVRRQHPTLQMPGKPRRFAILVPAHNEEAVIERTLQSLNRVRYPKEFFDVVVIADNCTDATAPLSRLNGATVFERTDADKKGKGYAIRWCLDRLLTNPILYDACVFIDADTVVLPNLLDVMNVYLEKGARCIQCSDMVTPQPGAWSPEMTRIAFVLHNHVRPLGKMSLGLSAGLNGNGMCFSTELLRKVPWSSFSRVEDLEYALQLTLQGERIQFAPETTVLATMPADSKIAETQRRRWEIARFPIVRHYAGRLLLASIKNRSLVVLDVLVELVTPAFVNLFLLATVMFALNAAGFVLGVEWLAGFTAWFAAVMFLDVVHVVGGLYAARAGIHDYLVLVKIPRFVVWKMALYIKTWLAGDDRIWIRTQRSGRFAR